MQELRLNEVQVKETINIEKLDKYQRVFDSMVVKKRVSLFKATINA
jgi:hypothetical protein